MKDDILNIINIEEITRVRNSINAELNLPSKNSLVSLIPIEFLEKGVKVLIDGKLFIAFIDEKIPLKEEIIALVISTKPFTLSLNFISFLSESKSFAVDQVLKKLKFSNNKKNRNTLEKVIKEEKPLIRSKLLVLSELTKNKNIAELEFLLLINLVWDYTKDDSSFIRDLYEDLFDETFDEVCEKLFTITKKVLFTDIAPFILHKLNNDLVYSEHENNSHSITNKSQTLLSLVKSINEAYPRSKSMILESFVKYSSAYILQKSILKEYDYFPDFAIVRQGGELTLVKYNIKKTISNNDVPIYKLSFSHEELPFELTGIIKDKFLVGNVSIEENQHEDYLEEVDAFSELFRAKESISSNLNINSEANKELELGMFKKGLNKLIS